jgi:hypothetical protein
VLRVQNLPRSLVCDQMLGGEMQGEVLAGSLVRES